MRQCQEIIDSAYARQKQGAQGVDADEDNELRPQLEDIIGTLFGIGARVNPSWFSKLEIVPWDPELAGWIRPATAEMVHWVEDADGTPVVRVPRDEPDAEPGSPTVYRLGGVYFPTGSSLGPDVNAGLTFIFAKRPAAIPELSSDIDDLFPQGHESLPALELAIYIALKDGRQADVSALVAQRDARLLRFLQFLEHEDVGERSRSGSVMKFRQRTIVPVSGLLLGGSSVEVP
jgi:hypothetical protein